MNNARFAAMLAAMIIGAPLAGGAQEQVQQEPPIESGQAAPSTPDGPRAQGVGPGGEAGPGMMGGGAGRGEMDHGMMGRGEIGRGGMGRDQRAHGTMGGRMMGGGMMGHGMMGHGAMGGDGHGMMGGMRMMMILMDTDGDGALSLEEVQAVHERIFRAADADGDGRLTLEEVRGFMRGGNQATNE